MKILSTPPLPRIYLQFRWLYVEGILNTSSANLMNTVFSDTDPADVCEKDGPEHEYDNLGKEELQEPLR